MPGFLLAFGGMARAATGVLAWTEPIEVVDAQLHLNQVGIDWMTATPRSVVTAAIAAMDAVGVGACVMDEVIGFDQRGQIIPGHDLANGARRSENPISELAAALHPDRIAFVTRVDRRDPDLEALIGDLRSLPGRLAVRITPPPEAGEQRPFAAGEYASLFELAGRHQVPVFVHPIVGLQGLWQYAEAYPQTQFIIDQCGVLFPRPGEAAPDRYSRLDTAIGLAGLPNVALKWANVQRLAREGFPFADAMPHLRRVVDAFGAGRVMWAGDFTQAQDTRREGYPVCSWAESLYAVLLAEVLGPQEKREILGGSVRRILRWPAAAPTLR